jgi:hypothetical protein
VGFGPWGFKSLRPHCRRSPALSAGESNDALLVNDQSSGALAKLAKAPVSKTGDSRFESWLPRLGSLA